MSEGKDKMSSRIDMEELAARDAVSSRTTFRRSSFCGELNCVEVAAAPDGSVLLRDTKDEENGPILRFTEQEWIDFLQGVVAGEFSPAALTGRS